MSNPFKAHFDKPCGDCGEMIEEGEDVYAVDGEFWCQDCTPAENICGCGNYKNEGYDTCYDCH